MANLNLVLFTSSCSHGVANNMSITIQNNTIQYSTIRENTIQYSTIKENTIQYKYEYYYSGINPVDLRCLITYTKRVPNKTLFKLFVNFIII